MVSKRPWSRRSSPCLRALAASVLLLFGAASAGRGYCPMRAPVPTGEQTGSHDCCKKGLTGAKPSCCHANAAADAVVLQKTAPAVTLAAACARILPVPVEVASAYAVATSTFASHSPPPSVLRI